MNFSNIAMLSAYALTMLGCTSNQAQQNIDPNSVNGVLINQHICSETIVLRYQSLDSYQLDTICPALEKSEGQFHQRFGTQGKPVADDHNHVMRANIYASREDFVRHATNHFNMPTSNGGMYLKGVAKDENNQAEFVGYVKDEQVLNLAHEYVHYLDRRFNQYGDYCNGLHDDHCAPEFSVRPTPAYPHLVWWGEGIAEYIVNGEDNPKAIATMKHHNFSLSDLFNTSYNQNSGNDRVYLFGYLAVRYMIENHPNRVKKMLSLTRTGDYEGYQGLVRSWGRTMDQDFRRWTKSL